MITLKFKINDYFLIPYILANYEEKHFAKTANEEHKQKLVRFQDIAWQKSQDIYKVLDGRCPIYMYLAIADASDFKESGNHIDGFIAEVADLSEYKELKEDTITSADLTKMEWDKNYEITQNYIDSLGINVEGEFNIWLAHPGLKAGTNMGNRNIIWSYQTLWENYNTVYIWHEILHSYFEPGEITHALIELITDEEMRMRLNGGSYPPYVGHKNLVSIKDRILPMWKDYLSSESTNINSLVQKIQP